MERAVRERLILGKMEEWGAILLTSAQPACSLMSNRGNTPRSSCVYAGGRCRGASQAGEVG